MRGDGRVIQWKIIPERGELPGRQRDRFGDLAHRGDAGQGEQSDAAASPRFSQVQQKHGALPGWQLANLSPEILQI